MVLYIRFDNTKFCRGKMIPRIMYYKGDTDIVKDGEYKFYSLEGYCYSTDIKRINKLLKGECDFVSLVSEEEFLMGSIK